MKIVVIGAGIAGASIAYFLAPHADVVLLEAEALPGMHSTGRSAALYLESYGAAPVRALNSASLPFFLNPPEGFLQDDAPMLSPRGALAVASAGQEALLEAHYAQVASVSNRLQRLTPAEVLERVPVIRREGLVGGVLEPDAMDMDVHRIHQGFLRGAKAQGAQLVCNARVSAIEYRAGKLPWHIVFANSEIAQADVVVNAAGAWADVVGAMAGARPIGLQPKRRSAFTFDAPAALDPSRWPAFIGVDETWYVKPDAGQLLGSPANQDPVEPQDVQAEELDIAMAIDRIQTMTTLTIRRPKHVWAGLRSFVSDMCLVGGWDPQREGFFWCAGQGGYGIQTSPAMGQACASIVLGHDMPELLTRYGVSAATLSPARCQGPS